MKKAYCEIILTLVIMYILGFTICGSYSFTTMGKFFTLVVIAEGMLFPCIYSLFLLINTRKNKLSSYIIMFDIVGIFFLLFLHFQAKITNSIAWNWKYTTMYIGSFLTFPLSRFQGNRYLLAKKIAKYHGHRKRPHYKPHSFKGRRYLQAKINTKHHYSHYEPVSFKGRR